MNEQQQDTSQTRISKEDSKMFFTELSKLPEIQNYVYLEVESSPRTMQQFNETCSELNNKYNYDHFIKYRSHTDEGILSDILLLVSHDSLNYHKIKFIIKEIKQDYQKTSDIFNLILDFLDIMRQKSLCHCPIQVETSKILKNSKTLTSLLNARTSIEKDTTYHFHRKNQLSPENHKLYSMIASKMAPEYFERSAIYPIHYIQNIFDAVISQPNFTFYHEIQSLINQFDALPPNHFMNILIETRDRIRDNFEVKQKNSGGVFFILLVRFIFDQIYPNNHYFTAEYDPNYLITISRTNFSKLGCDLSYFNQETKPLHTIRKTLSKDRDYMRAIQLLEAIQFHTNPIDILGSAYRSIEEAAKVADCYQKANKGQAAVPIDKKSEVFSRIFAAVILASNIPELQLLMKFVDDYVTDNTISDTLYDAKLIFKASADLVFNIGQK